MVALHRHVPYRMDMQIDGIHPVVLVGGRSTRYGEDKLRVPLTRDGAEWLVDRPIGALRAVFGARVTLVGDCHPSVALRADAVLADGYRGTGPAGGILTALEQCGGDVFVLAGDLPHITPATVRALLDAAAGHPASWVVCAVADVADACDGEPCIALYRHAVCALLAERLHAGRGSLHDLVPAERRCLVSVPSRETANVNTPGALAAALREGMSPGE